MGLVRDDCYAARRAAGRLVCVLYRRFSSPKGVFTDVKAHLCLRGSSAAPQDAEHVETSMLLLGEEGGPRGLGLG
jgi:hypothetical protein